MTELQKIEKWLKNNGWFKHNDELWIHIKYGECAFEEAVAAQQALDKLNAQIKINLVKSRRLLIIEFIRFIIIVFAGLSLVSSIASQLPFSHFNRILFCCGAEFFYTFVCFSLLHLIGKE